MDLSLLIFTLEIHQFCMKCIEFTTRTYNFKNLAVGSLIWSSKTGVNWSYFPQKNVAAAAVTGGVIEILTWSHGEG